MGDMKRVISKYGAYTTHLTALSEDTPRDQKIDVSSKVIVGNGWMQSTFLAVLSFAIFFHLV